MLAEHFKQLKPLEIGGDKPRGDVDVGGAKPDVWLKPEVVWEVLTADLSLSPIYTAAKGLVSFTFVVVVSTPSEHTGLL